MKVLIHNTGQELTIRKFKGNLVAYKRYVMHDQHGYHLCIKDDDMEIGTYLHGKEYSGASFAGISSTHFFIVYLDNLYEIVDGINVEDYEYKDINTFDEKAKNCKSKAKMKVVKQLLKEGWSIVSQTSHTILERKK